MKFPSTARQSRFKSADQGFALVVTLSLMVLLTLVAVGLLTLSSITLRSAGQGGAMATARDNARLGLILALGELQKAAGPDQRITAPANLIDRSVSPGITGVWESWKPAPSGQNDYASRKGRVQTSDDVADGEFVGWLASGDPNRPPSPVNPPGEAGPGSGAITLVSERESAAGIQRGVHLDPLRVSGKGSLAWNILDEGTKARIDLPVESVLPDAAGRLARLRAPGRPQVEAISDSTIGLRVDSETAVKLVSLNQGDLQLGGADQLRPYLHDLTPYSASLPVNVAEGGVKADLTRAFEENTLPADLLRRFVYSNSDTRFSESDPRFSSLAAYYRLYRSRNNPLQISTPQRYTPVRPDPRTRQNAPNLAALDGSLVAPVVTRVSVVFSLVSRLAHGNWPGSIRNVTNDPQRTQMVYLIYTPVITVYNPYSVPIQFRDLKVTFRNLPVAFQFFRNGVPQTNQPTLMSTFHISSQDRNNWDDPFSLTTSTSAGAASGSLVTLYPGEARVFGTSHSPGTTWDRMTNYLWQNDLDSSKTKNVYSGPGWDYRSGYIVDWLRPSIGGRTSDNGSLGVFAVRPTDTVNVQVVPRVPDGSGGKFTVEMHAKVNNRDAPVGVFEYEYGSQARLQEILGGENDSATGKITFPFQRERPWNVSEITLSTANSAISTWGSAPKQFAIFSLGARTSNDSLYPGKPGRNSSFVQHVLQMNATRNHPALLPMELSLRPITGAGANTVGSIDADDADRAFYFSGTSRGTGSIQYVSQNLPTAPLVNLADLRHANLASSGHLPLTPYTVGESLASPMVSADSVRQTGLFGYEVVDHAWLANNSLWDGYYFSGIRNESDARLLFGNHALPLNPRKVALTRPGLDADEAAGAAVSPAAWADVAAMLAVKGGFNVNSTSKNAWIAVLSSLRGLEIPVLGPVEVRDPTVNPSRHREVIRVANDAAFPRLSRPISDLVNVGNSADNQRRWSGFRELDELEIERLAEAIVEEVRARGPFLSLAEFVNRRVGPASDDKTTAGALEAAIRNSGVNDIPMGFNDRFITEGQAATFGYANPKAAAGHTEEGASALISQGDLLSAIGAAITVRSDTFVIRSYGDARDASGRVTARVWCEAVVQRVPSFVDPADAPEKVQAALSSDGRSQQDLNAVNQRFGRRFEIVSFRWLPADEV